MKQSQSLQGVLALFVLCLVYYAAFLKLQLYLFNQSPKNRS